jgi:hypothetical protein
MTYFLAHEPAWVLTATFKFYLRMASRGKKVQVALTAEQRNEIKEAFDLFDVDGYVTLPLFVLALRSPPPVFPPHHLHLRSLLSAVLARLT